MAKKFSLLLFSQSQNAGPSNTTLFTFIYSYFSQVCFLFNKAFLDLVYNLPKTNFEFWIYQCLPQNETPDCYLVTKYIITYLLAYQIPTYYILNPKRCGLFLSNLSQKKIQKVLIKKWRNGRRFSKFVQFCETHIFDSSAS